LTGGALPWHLRGAEPTDAAEIAGVHRRSRFAAMPWLPDLHTPDEDVAYFTRAIPASVGWVASGVEADRILGFALASDGWLNHLYIDTEAQGVGIGSALLAEVCSAFAPGLRLWAFQRNGRARAFYALHGFVEIELTDGRGNEEREPDVLLELR
jgi:putative acetyltransferase